MHPNEKLITKFYEAFQRRDGKTIASCYAADASFSDPVFPDLHGGEVTKMWRMLAAAGAKDLEMSFHGVLADDNSATAHWEAKYSFSQTGRRVHNKIESHFELRNGLILRHVDSFSFWRWSRQALGPVGWLLGWTPLVKNKVRRQAAARLAAFSDRAPSSSGSKKASPGAKKR